MSIRQALLAILALGPCYGYQLRLEFERRTGASAPLNVGQVYTTLDRLERDALVVKHEPDALGHIFYAITDAGRADAREWLTAPVLTPSRDELAAKLALALTLPGADAERFIAAQREAAMKALARQPKGVTLEQQLVAEANTLAIEAQLTWLDRCETLLARAEPYGLEVEPPRRGRPATAAAS